MAQGHSVDEYLETIYFLAFPIGEYRPQTQGAPTLSARVAEMLGVTPPSSRERAERVVRKHRLVERLLTDFMGYTPAEAHVHADEIGESFSDDMIERISERLGHPDRCPHGWPVDTEFEQVENLELAALSELTPGSSATIVRLAEHDGELLHWFYDQGFVPGTEVEVREAQPAAEQLTVRLNGDEKTIAEKAAAGLFVRPAG